MKKIYLAVITLIILTKVTVSTAGECGGKGYTGKDDAYCLKCHKTCPSIHPIFNVKVEEENKCIKIPESFPLRNGYLLCITCHNMESNTKYFLRSSREIETRTDFCFECHIRECYAKFNPHEAIVSEKLIKKEKLKACAYCHGVGAKEDAYLACTGCHTKTPHAGAIEHLKASKKALKKLIGGSRLVVDIKNMKDVNPKLKLEELKKRKPRIYIVNGKIECITCHNPHPQIAITSKPLKGKPMEIAREDFEYKLKNLESRYFEFNDKEVKLMNKTLKSGGLCRVCHSLKSLK